MSPCKNDPGCNRYALTLLAAIVVASCGCEAVQSVIGSMAQPKVRFGGVQLTNIDVEGMGLVLNLEVNNPYSVSIPVVGLGYEFASGGSQIVEGTAKVADGIPPGGWGKVAVPVRLGFTDVFKAVVGAQRGGVFPYEAKVVLGIDVPGAGRVDLPVKRTGELPIPSVPGVQVESLRWESLTLNKAAAVMLLRVDNGNSFAVGLDRLGYGLKLGGSEVVSSSINDAGQFQDNQSRQLEVPIRFSPMKLGVGVFRMLQGRGAGYEITGTMSLDTRFGQITMPYQKAGTTRFGAK